MLSSLPLVLGIRIAKSFTHQQRSALHSTGIVSIASSAQANGVQEAVSGKISITAASRKSSGSLGNNQMEVDPTSMDWPRQLQVIGEVALAILLGGVIGIERELANKPAGFRTHMLVAAAAALLVGLGDALLQHFVSSTSVSIINSDPMRIVGAIITGITFLGAGTIFRHETHVEGLTTAASFLLSGAIGMAVALHQFIIAGGITLLTLIVLRGVVFIEQRLKTPTIEKPD